jgi:pimeloyl-ACP methyl ester carboxylesterase
MPDATPATHQEDYVTVAGCRTFYMRGGKGKTLLFLHGAGGGSTWLPFLDDLAKRFDVVAPEHPGFGRSGTPEWLDRVSDLAFFYREFIRTLGLKDVHLVGTSFGGWVAAEIAVRSTQSLASLTLVCAAGLHVPGVEIPDVFLWKPEEATRNMFTDQKLADAILSRSLSEEEQDRQLKNRLTVAKLSWHPRMHNPDLTKWLHLVDVPTFVLWGSDDKALPVAFADEFVRLIPGARARKLVGCGHLPQIERREEFVSELSSFIDESGR